MQQNAVAFFNYTLIFGEVQKTLAILRTIYNTRMLLLVALCCMPVKLLGLVLIARTIFNKCKGW